MIPMLVEAIRVRLVFASPEAHGRRALGLLATDPRRAVVAAEALYDRFPESMDALAAWSECHWRRGDVPVAAKAYQRLTEFAPEWALGWLGDARCARAVGDLDRQRASAQRALELWPASAEAQELAGTLTFRQEGPAEGELPLIAQGQQRFLALEINGQPLPALCSTGTTGLIVAAHEAERFGLDPGAPRAEEVRAGAAVFRDVPVTVVPFPEGFGFSALFGPDLFRDSTVEIDAEANRLRWSPEPGGGGPLWLSGYHWVMPVNVDGHEETFALDTGSPHTIVDDRLLRGEPLRGAQLPFRFVATMQGPQEVCFAPRTELRGATFDRFHDCVTARLLPDLPEEALRPAGLLGLDFIQRVRLDYPRRRAEVEAWPRD